MVVTPEEALTKRCCQMDKMCEASACMAWREHFVSVPVPTSHVWPVPMPPRPERSGKGFCGLAHGHWG